MASAMNIVSSNASSATSVANAQAANGSPSSRAPSATGAAAAQDNDFMQLMTALLGGNAESTPVQSTSESSSASTAPSKDAKDDKQAGQTDAVPQWLLSPLAPQTPAIANNVGTDETIDALTPANNVGTNALLAQSLKRLSSDKSELPSSTTNKATDGNEVPEFLSSKQDSSPLDVMLNSASAMSKTPIELPGADKAKDHPATVNDTTMPSLQAMNTLQASINNTDNAAVAPQYQIHSHVGSNEWANEVGNRLTLMASHKVQSASLQLNPDNLGPVQVKIEVNNNQANVWFTADHPDTRTALEQSLPRLRELFASQGMSLMDAGVFGQQARQQPAPSFSRDSQPSLGMTDMSHEATMTQHDMKIGLLDTYA
jgi:flagellar hook-length control protein FliK